MVDNKQESDRTKAKETSIARLMTGNIILIIILTTTLVVSAVLGFTIDNAVLAIFGRLVFWLSLIILAGNLVFLLLAMRYLFNRYFTEPLSQLKRLVDSYSQGKLDTSPPSIPYHEYTPILEGIQNLGKQFADQVQKTEIAEARYSSIFDHGVIGVFRSSLAGRFVNMNPVLAEIFGYNSPAEAIEQITDIPSQVYANPEDRLKIIDQLKQSEKVISSLTEFKRRNGEHFPANMSLRALRNEKGDVEFLEGFIEDFTKYQRVMDELTQYRLYLEDLVKKRTADLSRQNLELQREIMERKEVEEALRNSEERYRMLAQNVSDVIWTVDFDGIVNYTSPSIFRLRGFHPEEVLHQSIFDHLTPASAKIARHKLKHLSELEVDDNTELTQEVFEMELLCRDGSTVWTETRISRLFDTQGHYTGLLGVTRDISDKKKAREKLRVLAITDALTGIYNRGHFYELANMELQRASRYKHDLSVIMFDIDGFKQINDTFGHFGGDEVLRALTRKCSAALRENDIFARFGGDEFVIMLPETNLTDSVNVANRLQQDIQHMKIPYENTIIQTTISLGTTSYTSDNRSSSLDRLLNLADQALYQAKQKGRNQVMVMLDHPPVGENSG